MIWVELGEKVEAKRKCKTMYLNKDLHNNLLEYQHSHLLHSSALTLLDKLPCNLLLKPFISFISL